MLVPLHDLATSRRSDQRAATVWRGSWDFPCSATGNLPPAVLPRAGVCRGPVGAGRGGEDPWVVVGQKIDISLAPFISKQLIAH